MRSMEVLVIFLPATAETFAVTGLVLVVLVVLVNIEIRKQRNGFPPCERRGNGDAHATWEISCDHLDHCAPPCAGKGLRWSW